MKTDITHYTATELVPQFRERRMTKAAKETQESVRLAGMKVDGTRALAGYMMQGLVELDALRQSLSLGDPILAAMLMDIEANAVRQFNGIQNSLHDQWGL